MNTINYGTKVMIRRIWLESVVRLLDHQSKCESHECFLEQSGARQSALHDTRNAAVIGRA